MIGCLVFTIFLAAAGYCITENSRWWRVIGGVGALLMLVIFREYIAPDAGAAAIIFVSAMAVGGGYLLGWANGGAGHRIGGALLIAIALFALNDGLLKNGPDLFAGLFPKKPVKQVSRTAYTSRRSTVAPTKCATKPAMTRRQSLPKGIYKVLCGKNDGSTVSLTIINDYGYEKEVNFSTSDVAVVIGDSRNILIVDDSDLTLKWDPKIIQK